MSINKISFFIISLVTSLFLGAQISYAQQPFLQKDYSYSMKIPEVITISSSPAHMYVLSETEGMVVFRAQSDTLQWLYSSSGMERRGDRISSDIRFSYLMGDDNRLTVLEPTSVLGVYSSTELPAKPIDAKRIDQTLFIAIEGKGIGHISLQTPSSVDSTVTYLDNVNSKNITDLEVSGDTLFALGSDQKLYILNDDNGTIKISAEQDLKRSLKNIFHLSDTLYGSDNSGNIYQVATSGELTLIGSINKPVQKMALWNDWLIIKSNTGELWTSYNGEMPSLWKENTNAGNYFTVIKGNLWISEYNQLSRVVESYETNDSDIPSGTESFEGSLKLKEISNQTITHSQPLILPIQFESTIPAEALQITYHSESVDNAEIRGQSFYWRPNSQQTGTYKFNIIANSDMGATDSTSFSVEVRSFNAPPRFSPIRPISIPVGEEFTLPVRATDPDGMSRDLIRYIGVDLPDGASINEKTGDITWTPTARQEGDNRFRVIATDQYGAASSVDIQINVVQSPTSDTLDS